MTEKNIDHLISMLMVFGFLYYIFSYFKTFLKASNKTAEANNTTDTQNNIWDKLKTVATIIGAIAAIIYACVKVAELIMK